MVTRTRNRKQTPRKTAESHGGGSDNNSLLDAVAAKDPQQLRELRKAEADLKTAQMALRLEQAKRKQAESELELADRWKEISSLVTEHETHVAIKPVKKGKAGHAQSTPILCCNDWHLEQEIDCRTVNGLNSFDLDIARERIERLWQKAVYLISFWRNLAEIRNCVLWLGGDLVSGSIHPELEEVNQVGPVDATSMVVDYVSAGIRCLLDYADIDSIHVVCNGGNHGRTIQKPRHATAFQHSYETLAYLRILDRFHDVPNVTFQISRSYHAYVTLYDRWQIRFHHGNAMKFFGGVGGLSIVANKSVAQWNKSHRVDYDIFGHFHVSQDNWNWVSCGALCGYDPFALSIKGDFQPPTQTAIFIDKEHGKVATLPVFIEGGTRKG